MSQAWPDWLVQASSRQPETSEQWRWKPPLEFHDESFGVIEHDFAKLGRRCSHRQQDPLYLAVQGVPRQRLVDMTGGFGDDAAFLASLGFQVQTFERHPLVYTFLKETESWAQRQGYALEAHFGSAQEQMNEILAKPSLILIDPMFEETGSAKPAKPMQWLRKLALPWSELEWERNLSWARTQAQHAVLIKSPKGQRTLPEARRFAAQSFNWELLEPF